MYTCKTRTAAKIGKLLNRRAGYETVIDVRRIVTGPRRGWEVDTRPYSAPMLYGDMVTLQFQSFKMVERGIAQVTMFPDLDATS